MSAKAMMVEQARTEIAKADAIQGSEPWAIRALLETIDEREAELARAQREVDAAHEELDAAGIQRTSFGGPFGDAKYEERTLNLAGRIHCLAAAVLRPPTAGKGET